MHPMIGHAAVLDYSYRQIRLTWHNYTVRYTGRLYQVDLICLLAIAYALHWAAFAGLIKPIALALVTLSTYHPMVH